MDQLKRPEPDQRQQRHREIAAFVEDTKDTPRMALDPALEQAGIEAWLAAIPDAT